MATQRAEHDDYSDVLPILREIRSERDDDLRAKKRDEVIERCLPLADHVARRFSDRGEPVDDLRQVARIGLMHAVDRFDGRRHA